MESCTRMFELTTSARSSFVRKLCQKVASPGARCVRPDAWCVVLATSHVQAMAAIRPRAYQTAARGGRKLRGSVRGGPSGAGLARKGAPTPSAAASPEFAGGGARWWKKIAYAPLGIVITRSSSAPSEMQTTSSLARSRAVCTRTMESFCGSKSLTRPNTAAAISFALIQLEAFSRTRPARYSSSFRRVSEPRNASLSTIRSTCRRRLSSSAGSLDRSGWTWVDTVNPSQRSPQRARACERIAPNKKLSPSCFWGLAPWKSRRLAIFSHVRKGWDFQSGSPSANIILQILQTKRRRAGPDPAISQRGVRKRVKSLWERDFCVKRQGAHFCACFFRHFGHENP